MTHGLLQKFTYYITCYIAHSVLHSMIVFPDVLHVLQGVTKNLIYYNETGCY